MKLLAMLPRLRAIAQRFGVGLLIVASMMLMMLGKADLKLIEGLRERAGDLARPVLAVAVEPLVALRHGADGIGAALALRDQNRRLRAETSRLAHWQQEAVRLAVENAALREVLKMPARDRSLVWTTARIVGDQASPFIHTRLLDAGEDRGLRNGMAVLDETGLIGRVVAVGGGSARVLLLTDFNSRIPVLVDGSRDQAILEGTNGDRPILRFLPLDPRFAIGDRVLTSGKGGVFPPGLLIGHVAAAANGVVEVAPAVDWNRLDFVSVLHYVPILPPERTAEPGVPPLTAALELDRAGAARR